MSNVHSTIEPESIGTESPDSTDVDSTEPRYFDQHAAYLTDRAIDLGLAWREGVRSLTEDQARAASRCRSLIGTALGFAYGQIGDPYCRVQLDDREANDGKTRAPPGVTPPPYILSTTTTDETSPLFVVEAPAKALSLASNGFADVIGCGGVDAGVFDKGTRDVQTVLLPYVCAGRRIDIAFDAGRASNPRVAWAEARIARALLDCGCDVRCVELPLPEGGGDQGPDDFIATNGADAFAALVAAARPAAPLPLVLSLGVVGREGGLDALASLPLLAALAAGTKDDFEQAAVELKGAVSKKELKAAIDAFRASLKGTGEPSTDSTSTRPTFERGDEVEIALHHLAQLGPDVVYDEGAVYRYKSGIWKDLPDEAQRRAIGGLAGCTVGTGDSASPLKLSHLKIEGSLKHFKDVATRRKNRSEPGFFAGAARGLCFANGFLRVAGQAAELEPHAQEHRARFAYPFDFDPAAACPMFVEYLRSVWHGDGDGVQKEAALQQFVGASLVGLAPRYKTALVLHGDANTGKSTALDVIRGVFPPGSATSIALHDFENEYRRAKLAGKLINLVAEVPSHELVRSEAFKALIAGDSVEGREIRQSPFDFVPVAGHVFAANTLPRVADRSEGTWIRFMVLSFNRTFARDGADASKPLAKVGLADQILEAERPGIVAWAVEGLRALLAIGAYTRPPSSARALADWRAESNPLEFFVDEELVLNATGKGVTTARMYERYREWAERNGFSRAVLTSITFGKAIKATISAKLGRAAATGLASGYTIYKDVAFKPTLTDSYSTKGDANFNSLLD